MAKVRPLSRYAQIMERVFFDHFTPGDTVVPFTREKFESVAVTIGIKLPKNLGDIIYSFKYRKPLPPSVRAQAPAGTEWVLVGAGRSLYQFEARGPFKIAPTPHLVVTKVLNATPGLVVANKLDDEQALLSVLRYNRLIDLFTNLVCYALQSHLRTFVPGIGQIETDDLYVGVDRRGVQYVLPVQAKGGPNDRLHIVQIEQDVAFCAEKFPNLICRPIAAQFMPDGTVALFAFEQNEGRLAIAQERHYRLVAPGDLSPDELRRYAERPE